MPYRDIGDRRKACQDHYLRNKDYYLQRNIARREALRLWVDRLKVEGGACVVCDHTYPPRAMDWHHRNAATKDFDLGVAVNRMFGRQRILNEIAKCDLMCAVCHRLVD